ncbi:hypothetical protein CANINC_001122 [Pichia inconspicua]|uniref:Vacuolar-sorting protein SNF8 n=1 Tax=Pichia inconspicua TaxID=52247 RepID=A0A4T0X5I7_9ASCO|nr:hypothetical protein CANINC_001122 [[Candida] inconspicua]
MSTGRGLSSLNNDQMNKKFQELGSKIVEDQRNNLETQLQVFQAALISFKNEHADEILHNEAIGETFAKICISFGIDPLVVATTLSDDINNNSERLNQLSIKIIELCTASRPMTGGILSINDLLEMINQDTWVSSDLQFKFKESDILEALNHLKVLGDELQLIQIGKKKYIKNIPQDLNIDQNTIIETAEIVGYVSVGLLRDNFGWKRIRAKDCIDEMVSNGILWVDRHTGEETRYWISSWINKSM